MHPRKKILDSTRLQKQADKYHANRRLVVTTNGCFDLLHAGHYRSLEKTRRMGDVLFVGINSDASVQRLKGPTRPIINQEDRAYQLSCLSFVDWVYIFPEDTPIQFLSIVRPTFHCKGGDYDPHNLPETPIVEQHGGTCCSIPIIDSISTTDIILRCAQVFDRESHETRRQTPSIR